MPDGRYFVKEEGRCRCGCGRNEMNREWLAVMDAIRMAYGKPIIVSSWYRCPDHDAEIGGMGLHPTGEATDCTVLGAIDRCKLVAIAIAHPRVFGIGVSKGFVHLDGVLRPHKRLWTY